MSVQDQTILIVEDESEIREGIRILLGGEGYTILEAADGPQALELLSSDIDLIILDVMMPGMNGYRVCEEIRKQSSAPVLFLTAKAQEADKLVGLSAGGDDYLTKPFSYVELIARVKALLRRYCVYGTKESGDAMENRFIELGEVRIACDYNGVWVRGSEVGSRFDRNRISDSAASYEKPNARFLGAKYLRVRVERAVHLFEQRNRDGPYSQAPCKNREGPQRSEARANRLGQGLSIP